MIEDILIILKLDILLKYWKYIGGFLALIILLIFLYKLKKRRDLRLWTQSNFMNLSYIRRLDGFKFEDYVANQFKNLGIEIRRTPKSGDFGIDLIVEEEYAIQLKNYSNTVGISAIQEAYSGAAYYNKKPVVMVTHYYTKAAIELATALGVELIDLDDIKNWGNNYYKRSYLHKRGVFEFVEGYLLKDLRIKR